MPKEIRNHIDSFEEFSDKGKKTEVIVSYDCSEIHKKFEADLLYLLKSKYKCQKITLSNYKIGKSLSTSEIIKLEKEIKKLFDKVSLIVEGKRHKKTIVSLILANKYHFIIRSIIDQTID